MKSTWDSDFCERLEAFPRQPRVHLSLQPASGYSTRSGRLFSPVPQNISLRQQQFCGRADANFTSEYVVTWPVVGGLGCLCLPSAGAGESRAEVWSFPPRMVKQKSFTNGGSSRN